MDALIAANLEDVNKSSNSSFCIFSFCIFTNNSKRWGCLGDNRRWAGNYYLNIERCSRH